jgi:pyruvate formate lyase activating enzyme
MNLLEDYPDMEATVFGIQKFSIHDGPGIRTAIFFKGCNLHCRWCANPESQDHAIELIYDVKVCLKCKLCEANCAGHAIQWKKGCFAIDKKLCSLCRKCLETCPAGAISFAGRKYQLVEIISEVLKDKAFYDQSGGGVTLSGGEPLMQSMFLSALIDALHTRQIHVALETAACVPLEQFAAIAGKVDLLLVDFKHYDTQMHILATGSDNRQVAANIKYALTGNIPLIVRIPVIPGFNDSNQDARGFTQALGSLGVHEVHLLPFHPFGAAKYTLLGILDPYANIPPLPKEDFAGFADILTAAGFDVQIGG